MIKQLLKRNKIIQRIKAIKDLFLEKLDTLNSKSDQQVGLSSLLLEETNKTQHNTNVIIDNTHVILEEGRQTNRTVNLLVENGAFLFKLSVDMVKGLQRVIEESQQQQQSIYQAIERIYQDSQQQQQSIYQAIERIYQEFQKTREESQTNKETLDQIYTDIHNQKFKVVTDHPYFNDMDSELMAYLYSYLPSNRAIDIGSHRGDVANRLLQAGYEVYAFEPFPPVLKKLTERLGDNPHLHIFPLAVGGANEERELHIVSDEKLLADPNDQPLYPDADYTLLSSLNKHSLPEGLVFTETVPIFVKTLESLHLSSEIPSDIGLVKIDTEGSDLEVILGMGDNRYPLVVAEFWDPKFPFAYFGANNKLEDMVAEMKRRGYDWFIVIYKIFASNDVSYYCNNKFSIENSWGNVFFFQDYQVFSTALQWCSSVMPATYFSTNI
jgi:FkbM family methyltransferase